MSLRRFLYCTVAGASFGGALIAAAESKNPADYPLRIHIFNRSETNFYHNRALDEAKGDGRANLFANGEVHAVDFSYECSEKLRPSFSYETYAARWKKPRQELVVLLPVFGKSGQFFTCNLKTDVKDFAYGARNGRLFEEPIDQFRAWMQAHDYDPEHGKTVPVRTQPAPGSTAGDTASAPPSPSQP